MTGRLLNAGLPIAGAFLEVLQQVDGTTLELIGSARTGSDGTFVASVPGGHSQTVEIAYRAFSTDTGYAAVAKLAESVDAGVQLGVSPRRTGSEGEITLSERVLGPVPSQGVIVELLVHYRGHWEPFRDPRTDSRGRFRGRLPIPGRNRAVPIPCGGVREPGRLPIRTGESRAVDVTTK